MAKNTLLTFLGVTAISALLSSCGPNNVKQAPTPYQGTYAPLSEFNDDVVLVACDNENEYNGVLESLHDRNSLRGESFKFSYNQRDNYLKVTVPNRLGEREMENSYIHIVKKENLDEVKDLMAEKGIKYDIVQLRGHQYSPMETLYEMTSSMAKEKAIFVFGGCNSYDLARYYSSENRPAIGGDGEQETFRNTYYLVRLIDLIGRSDISTWNDLYNQLDSDSDVFDVFHMPGKH